MQVSGLGNGWDDLPQDAELFGKLVLDDLYDVPSEERSVDAELPTDARDQDVQDGMDHGAQDS